MKPVSFATARNRLWASLAITVGVAFLAAGCGRDNPGEPRSPAEELSAPNLGGVHVYCVERDEVLITPCSVALEADPGHSPAELRNWWLHAGRALHKAGTFAHEGALWRFGKVFVYGSAHRADGGRVHYGWRCPGDHGHTELYVAKKMNERNPGGKHAIATDSAAQKRGCTFALYPDLSD
jgi:hypothetical protein